jgi:hypothetical protein
VTHETKKETREIIKNRIGVRDERRWIMMKVPYEA